MLGQKKAPLLETVYPTESVSLPVVELLESCRGIGNVQFPSDGDGIYRRMPLAYSLGDRIYPSLPLAVVQFLDESFDIGAVPLDASGQMILNYFGPTRIYPAYSAAALVNSLALLRQGQEPQIPMSTFKDKIVLIGGSAPGLMDLRPTPLSPVSPGVGIHATAIDNLLHENLCVLLPALVVVFDCHPFLPADSSGDDLDNQDLEAGYICLVVCQPAGPSCLGSISN